MLEVINLAEGQMHKKLKAYALKFLKEKVTDLVCSEVKYKNIRSIADSIGLNLKRKEIRIVEAKATKQDFVRDKKLFDIEKSYYKHCHYFYIICPENIIQLEDVPKEYGLLWLTDNNEIIVKRSPKKYTGRLKTMFDTSLKNTIKSLTNDYLFQYLYPAFEIEIELKDKFKKKRKKKTKKES